MLRAITGFHPDEVGDWVAELRCGHGQHVRHRPPFFIRPWVVTAEGRGEKLDTALECVLCDRFEMPSGHVAYKRTPIFEHDSIPDGLRRDHSTKHGVWGVIHVVAGRLRYIVEPPLGRELLLDPEHRGIVVPEVLHRVVADAGVRFFIEFYRAASV